MKKTEFRKKLKECELPLPNMVSSFNNLNTMGPEILSYLFKVAEKQKKLIRLIGDNMPCEADEE